LSAGERGKGRGRGEKGKGKGKKGGGRKRIFMNFVKSSTPSGSPEVAFSRSFSGRKHTIATLLEQAYTASVANARAVAAAVLLRMLRRRGEGEGGGGGGEEEGRRRWMIGPRIYFASVHARFLQHLRAVVARRKREKKGGKCLTIPQNFPGGCAPLAPPPLGGDPPDPPATLRVAMGSQ